MVGWLCVRECVCVGEGRDRTGGGILGVGVGWLRVCVCARGATAQTGGA